jgi:ATP adenylyltransferase
MKFDELLKFIESELRMSHVYQPLLISLLVDSGGAATIRQLAQEFALADEVNVLHYEKRIKEMPVPVLARHGVLSRRAELIELQVEKLTYAQRAQIRAACEKRIAEFLEKRGIEIWGGLLEMDPVPSTVRYDVLKRDRKCVLCGAIPSADNDVHLHVDHVTPRSKGGSNDFENLQTLCSECNLGKSNRDDTAFRAAELGD